jgi:hypothetical protein
MHQKVELQGVMAHRPYPARPCSIGDSFSVPTGEPRWPVREAYFQLRGVIPGHTLVPDSVFCSEAPSRYTSAYSNSSQLHFWITIGELELAPSLLRLSPIVPTDLAIVPPCSSMAARLERPSPLSGECWLSFVGFSAIVRPGESLI